MMQHSSAKWILAAAVSITLAGSAFAQYRIGSDGHALDANTRVGSGGLNETSNRVLPYNIGNNIVTGNVTGGREFRGRVPYAAPGDFRGPTAGSVSDAFIRQSSGAPYSGAANNAQVVQPFFGDSQATPPPPGFVQQSIGSGAYVPGTPVTRQPGDMRLGVISNTPVVPLPAPGQFFLPGPVDPSTQNSTLLSASPLYGVRQWDPTAPADQQQLNSMNQPRTLDQQRLDRLREEVTTPDESEPGAQDSNPNGPNTLNNATSAFENPQNNALTNPSMLGASRTNNEQLNNNGASSGIRRRLMSPSQQSTQYSQLQQRLQQYETARATNDANERGQYNRDLLQSRTSPNANAGRGGNASATPGSITPAAVTPGVATPGRTGLPGAGTMGTGVGGAAPNLPMPGAVATAPPGGIEFSPSSPAPANPNVAPDRPAPLQIKSLAEGVQAPALAEILKEAEKEMKAGRFSLALSQYDLAEQTVPNNPLVRLGRANVELAQSYYARAAQHLRDAFMNENGKPLLMGQVDLRSWFGNEKLEFLVNDLKANASRETKEPRHVFLLAYIAYNTGNEAAANGYLTLAEQRSEGKDELYPLLRRYWSLPQAPSNR